MLNHIDSVSYTFLSAFDLTNYLIKFFLKQKLAAERRKKRKYNEERRKQRKEKVFPDVVLDVDDEPFITTAHSSSVIHAHQSTIIPEYPTTSVPECQKLSPNRLIPYTRPATLFPQCDVRPNPLIHSTAPLHEFASQNTVDTGDNYLKTSRPTEGTDAQQDAYRTCEKVRYKGLLCFQK